MEDVEIMVFAYAIDDGPVRVWDLTDPSYDIDLFPDLEAALADPQAVFYYHKDDFDRNMLAHARPDLAVPLERHRCTMAKALAHGLPGALEKLCEIFNVAEDKKKQKIGKSLVQLFCKPRPKTSKLSRATRLTHPDEWARFLEYAGNDVEAMRVVERMTPEWNYRGRELDLWFLDQKINDRGVCVDLDLAKGALKAITEAQVEHGKTTMTLTEGNVEKATQRDKLLEYILAEHGVALPDMRADTLERRLSDESLPQVVRDLIAVRLESSMTSGSKYKRLVEGVSSDGRLRGLLQFCGAMRTGRWAGRMLQPQNLPRPTMPQDEIEIGVEAIKTGNAALLFDDVMTVCSNAIRGVIVSSEGKRLVVSDLANIEGRITAWLAGEEWKLQAFRDYDAGTGEDLYKLSYASSFRIEPKEVSKPQRQIGKVQELMFGYGGGVGAYVTGAATYRIDLEDMARLTLPTIPDDVLEEASGMWDWAVDKKRTYGLPRDVFCACDSIKRLWRRAHPMTAALWYGLEDTVRKAINVKGVTLHFRMLKVRCEGNWLRIQLPSGRALCYVNPRVGEDGGITYMGVNQYSRKWSRLHTYGGKLVENVVQAIARDVLADAMPRAEEQCYKILLTVHDELITEAPDIDDFNDEELGKILATNPDWADGLPLAASGFTGYRYKKD